MEASAAAALEAERAASASAVIQGDIEEYDPMEEEEEVEGDEADEETHADGGWCSSVDGTPASTAMSSRSTELLDTGMAAGCRSSSSGPASSHPAPIRGKGKASSRGSPPHAPTPHDHKTLGITARAPPFPASVGPAAVGSDWRTPMDGGFVTPAGPLPGNPMLPPHQQNQQQQQQQQQHLPPPLFGSITGGSHLMFETPALPVGPKGPPAPPQKDGGWVGPKRIHTGRKLLTKLGDLM